jgi:uncharacterized protein YigA (DUF484 family)
MAGAAAIADLFGPPAVQLAVAVEPLPLAALRVVVGATRDVELAVARQRHEDLRGYIEHSDARCAAGLNTEIRRLRRRLEINLIQSESREAHLRRVERDRDYERAQVERNLTRSANELVGYIARAELRMPSSVLQAIQLMRRGGLDEDLDPYWLTEPADAPRGA